MGLAGVTPTEYGYMVTNGNSATTIAAGKIRIKAMSFSGNADNATAALTSIVADVATSCFKFKSNDTNELNSASGNFVYFGENGVPFTGLAVTLSSTSDHLYIYLA